MPSLFVLQLYGQPSSFIWEDDDGRGPRHRAGRKKASKGIFSCQPCSQFVSMKPSKQFPKALLPSEKLFAFLEDIFIVATAERLAILHMETALWDHARIRINHRKDEEVEPCSFIARAHCLEAGRRASHTVAGVGRSTSRCRRMSRASASWGTPFGHCDDVKAEVRSTNEEQSTLLKQDLGKCAICSARFAVRVASLALLRHCQGQTTCCGFSLRRSPNRLRQCAIPLCGTAFASCWISLARQRCWTEPGCPWQTEGWA